MMLDTHFAEDRENFAKMNARADRTEILLAQMGEHLSHFRRDMNIITSTQITHAEESKAFRLTMTDSIGRIENTLAPLAKIHADQVVVDEKLASMGEVVKKIAGVIVALSAIGGSIMYVIKKFL